MSEKQAPDRLITRSYWPVHLISYLLILVVAFRRVSEMDGILGISMALTLLGLFTLLYASEPRLSKRFKSYPLLYFTIQIALVQLFSIIQEYIDAWAMLYIVLGFQVAARCSRREALVWGSLFVASTLITLSVEYGLISGLGRALAYIVIGVFLVSFNIQYAQHEDALADSQLLLAELQQAHQKLQEYAAQAETLATVQERNRMIQELYDSVGQKIFAIQLAAESARLVLDKDPPRAAGQIEDLQTQTQSALGQLRQLIGQWRPG